MAAQVMQIADLQYTFADKVRRRVFAESVCNRTDPDAKERRPCEEKSRFLAREDSREEIRPKTLRLKTRIPRQETGQLIRHLLRLWRKAPFGVIGFGLDCKIMISCRL